MIKGCNRTERARYNCIGNMRPLQNTCIECYYFNASFFKIPCLCLDYYLAQDLFFLFTLTGNRWKVANCCKLFNGVTGPILVSYAEEKSVSFPINFFCFFMHAFHLLYHSTPFIYISHGVATNVQFPHGERSNKRDFVYCSVVAPSR